jgi:hypothetical protein
MDMKTKLFFLLLGSIFIFASCDKDPTKKGYQHKPPKPEFYRFRLGEAKNYLWAKPGSYWIYKQTVTGDLDTQVVTDFYFDSIISKGTQNHSKHLTIEYDKLIRNIKSSFNGWTYSDKTSAYNAEATPFKGLFFALNRQAFGGEIYALHYPFNSNENSGTGAEVTSFGGMDSTLIIQAKILTLMLIKKRTAITSLSRLIIGLRTWD